MPVRNEEEHIRASLQSLLDQSYPLSEYDPFGVDAKNYYAAEVGFYRDYFGPISEQVNGASSFLDVGCGTGRLLELFVGRNLYRAGIECFP